MKMKPGTRLIWEYVKMMHGDNFTAADIANATGLGIKVVNGTVTAMWKKGYMVRTPGNIRLEDGTYKTVSFISMTPKGLTVDPDDYDA